jgi:demethylmenaquinone methyltransferase / 2-methoxy-6-polyprenyl-1,4-benzoquinol methylase
VTADGRTGVAVSERVAHARRLFAGVAREYERMGTLLSLGQDGRWRRFLVSRIELPPGGSLLDVATGTGLVARAVSDRHPGATVLGLDQSEEMLRAGVWADAGRGRAPRTILLGRAERLPFADGTFDAVTFTYLLRYVDDPAATVAELARVLHPGGMLAELEFGLPANLAARTGWRAFTRIGLPLLGRTASRAWAETGGFLGPSIEGYRRRYPPPVQAGWWRRAGIPHPRSRSMSFGAGVVTWGRKEAEA